MPLVSNQFTEKSNITSHSLYITQLQKDTKNIEFVRQIIGHAKIDTTSKYVDELSDEEKQQRINKIKIPEDLIIEPETISFK